MGHEGASQQSSWLPNQAGGKPMKRRIGCLVVAMALATLACTLPPLLPTAAPPASATPVPSTLPPTDTPGPTPVPGDTPFPAGTGFCQAEAAVETTVFSRPYLLADVFGSLSPDLPIEISAMSSAGWLGFDPGVAQAANIGVFRLRWIAPGAGLILSGDCTAIPTEPWVPLYGVCYQMSMGPVEVHAAADPASAVNGMLDVGQFAAVLGRTPTGWLFVDGGQANTPGVTGFIAEVEMNASGPCESIPVINP
jgi:hypothetical protein